MWNLRNLRSDIGEQGRTRLSLLLWLIAQIVRSDMKIKSEMFTIHLCLYVHNRDDVICLVNKKAQKHRVPLLSNIDNSSRMTQRVVASQRFITGGNWRSSLMLLIDFFFSSTRLQSTIWIQSSKSIRKGFADNFSRNQGTPLNYSAQYTEYNHIKFR